MRASPDVMLVSFSDEPKVVAVALRQSFDRSPARLAAELTGGLAPINSPTNFSRQGQLGEEKNPTSG